MYKQRQGQKRRADTMKTKIPVGKIDHDEETENPVAPNEQKGNRLLMMIIAKA